MLICFISGIQIDYFNLFGHFAVWEHNPTIITWRLCVIAIGITKFHFTNPPERIAGDKILLKRPEFREHLSSLQPTNESTNQLLNSWLYLMLNLQIRNGLIQLTNN
jgi:hypothetical protein